MGGAASLARGCWKPAKVITLLGAEGKSNHRVSGRWLPDPFLGDAPFSSERVKGTLLLERTRIRVESRTRFLGTSSVTLPAREIEKMVDNGMLVVDHQPQGSLQALADRLTDDLQDFDTGMPFAV